MRKTKTKKRHYIDSVTGKAKAILSRVQGYFPGVEHIVDATKSIEIEVLAKDVSKRGAKNHALCAMATACKRARHIDGAVVTRTRTYLVDGDTATRYDIPQAVKQEIISFDRGASFEPGTYKLLKIPPSVHLGVPRTHAMKPGKRTGEHSKRHATTNIRTSFSKN